jgi:hypothetical protein
MSTGACVLANSFGAVRANRIVAHSSGFLGVCLPLAGKAAGTFDLGST